jgi:hypothetical protein
MLVVAVSTIYRRLDLSRSMLRTLSPRAMKSCWRMQKVDPDLQDGDLLFLYWVSDGIIKIEGGVPI